MYVVIRFKGKKHHEPEISKTANIKQLRKEAERLTGVPMDRQRLFFGGKQLDDKWVQINSICQKFLPNCFLLISDTRCLTTK